MSLILSKHAKETPDQVALIVDGEKITYENLEKSSNQLSNYLFLKGTRKGDRVGISLERSKDLIVAMLAIVNIGAIYVPIDTANPKERIEFIIEDSKISVLITTSAIISNMPVVNIGAILLDNESTQIVAANRINHQKEVEPTDVAYMMYTSGSTGTPKGVMVPHQGIIRLVCDTNYISINKQDTIPLVSTISFDASTLEIWGALLNGATLVIPKFRKASPTSICNILKENNISIMFLTTGLFNLMVEERLEYMNGLKYLITGGDVMSTSSATKAKKNLKNTRIINGYGPTENTVFTTFFEIPSNWNLNRNIPIGNAITNTNVYIMDEQLKRVKDGEIGELVAGGLGVARGYWNRKELTDEKFIEHNGERLYKTGDLVRQADDGNIEFLGRVDHQVKIRGFRIELGELETTISQFGSIKACTVMVNEVTPGDKRLVAFVVPKDRMTLELRYLKAFLEQKLPNYMLPSNYVIKDELPLTNNGKVDRNALSSGKMFTRPDLGISYQEPRKREEVSLTSIWEKILLVDKIGVNDDFFDLGGNSILVARAIIQMQESLQTKLPASVLYEYPTIAKICTFLNQDSIKAESLDLAAEVQLDQKIAPLQHFNPSSFKQKAIFLTGATGFLGAFLIQELLFTNPETRIYCLVRDSSSQKGLQRIQKNMEKYSIWKKEFLYNIIPITGDLNKPKLGLSSYAFSQLSETIDVIYHNGAKVNYVQSYELHKNTNVTGTKTILDFACANKLKPVHYLSTISVFGPIGFFTNINKITEDSNLNFSETYLYKDIGYAQSKWVAEKIMWEADKRGVPVTVFRPGFIMGHSRSGVNNTEDYVARLIKGCIQLGTYGDLPNQRKEFVPVDYVAKAICEISRNPSNFGEAYHLVPSYNQSLDIVDFFEEINKNMGYNINKTPYKEWVDQLVESTLNQSDNALTPFLPLLTEPLYKDKTAWELYENMPKYDSSNTQVALAESGLKCPEMNHSLLHIYFDYMIKIGFIPASPKLKLSVKV
ncbi:amino acid adenylation domain-containing protein/thioester reductase domain-containing protein [Gracilibacillus orientalis]|uniref:Amino acid adenylation domain-containing protein/thioester reductase domain-containing protein n=1 Tax=Gracilibacillus orientalis TaxID=334253 RepID=A0A1I4PU64_9BACI|nr:amino acid adenylation domain-containing protein [Gracilibacillus orientalis]SFM31013.1 amino acid adenylation domain-containing protein/thioester reductase domain-containing protein [Gracilibacillus orientalis]